MTNTPDATSFRGAVDLSALVNRPAPGAQGDADAEPQQSLPGLIYDGTDQNFNQFIELSNTVPVIVDLWAEWCEPCKQLSPALERVVNEYAGRFVLVKVDVDANPQLAQAFQAQSIPTVVAIIGGRPAPLFVGAIPEAQVRDVFEQVLQIAEQNGVTGSVEVDAEAGQEAQEEPTEPAPEPLPPHHQEAYDAIEKGDFDAAIAEYKLAIAQNPSDSLAVAGLAQVNLLKRLATIDSGQARAAAASAPSDLDAALDVADLDLSGGHVDDAFGRVLELFPGADQAGKDAIRERLLDYFEIVGVTDPRVIRARGRLASLLY
ncbi:tetratricopeptide repeat protein [Humibacter sp. RRB41]|uniref:tetratricopeptide repeat protein n=1 Tax=Humibacter sp. RRB41 TaxID=2919946 RepID=UPI001FA953D7|nr:tetratricopeptide repeat protein [Humibacter sp. RRB41]